MSNIVSLVLVAPDSWPLSRVDKLSRALYVWERTLRGYGPPVDEEASYDPIPARVGARWVAGGSKVPGGSIWWIGINHLNVDKLRAALGEDSDFHGVVVSYEDERMDTPAVFVAGAQAE